MVKKQSDGRGKPLPVDWESVVGFWLQNGRDYLATAKAFGIKKNTLVKHITRREQKGEILTPNGAKKVIEKGREALQVMAMEEGRVARVSPVDAFREQGERVRENLAASLLAGTEATATMDGLSVVDNSRKIKDLADTASKVFSWSEETGKAHLSINLLSLSADSLGSVVPTQSRPVVDITPH